MKRSFAMFLKRLDAIKFRDKIEKRSVALHVSLEDLYAGVGRSQSITVARRAVYLWLVEQGFSINEVARLFDRSPNGVWKMVKS